MCCECGHKDSIVTSDLADFGARERKMAAELLTALGQQGAPFLGDSIRVFMNRNSGYVFLSDEDFNVGIMNGDKLEHFFSCPECGAEGFAEDIAWNGKHGQCGECAPEGDAD